MSILDDGNEPHFVPRAVVQNGPAVVYGAGDNGHVHTAYDLADICANGINSRVIGRLIMGTLISHFSAAENIVYDPVKQYIYSDDPAESKIRIALNTTWDDAAAGNTPSIIVARGESGSVQRAIHDYAGRNADNVRTFMRHMQTNYAVYVSAKGDGALEYLVDEVFFMLHAQFSLLREKLPLHRADVTSISAPQPTQQGDHRFVCAIGMTFVYEFGWAHCPSTATALEYLISVRGDL